MAIGDIKYDTFNDDGRLPCKGFLYQSSEYPALAALANKQPFGVYGPRDFKNTVSGTPALPNTGYGIEFSPDGQYLAVGHAVSGSSYLTIIRTSDWGVVSGTPTLTGNGLDVSFSPDGQFLAVVFGSSAFLVIMRTSDKSVVSGTPALPNIGNGVSFSPDGQFLAVAHNSAPFLTIVRTSDWSVVSGT